MGDAWSGETDYDRNEGDRQRERATADRLRGQAAADRIAQTQLDPGGETRIVGDSNTMTEIDANLSQVATMNGQSMVQTGQQSRDYLASLQNRRSGGDAASQFMMDQKNRTMATMSRQMAGKGIAGGVAGAALNSADNGASSSIASSKQTFQAQNDKEYLSWIKKNQKDNGEALAQGKDAGLASKIDVSAAEGSLSICLYLLATGAMSSDLYAKEGLVLKTMDPVVLETYHLLTMPISRKMETSPVLVKVVTPIAMAWVEERTQTRPNLLGKMLKYVGEPTLKLLGKIRGA